MTRGPEGKLQDEVLKWLRANLPKPHVCWKISDNFTRGIPDCLCVFRNANNNLIILFLEFKREVSPGKPDRQSGIQKQIFEVLRAVGRGDIDDEQGRVETAVIFNEETFSDLRFWVRCQCGDYSRED